MTLRRFHGSYDFDKMASAGHVEMSTRETLGATEAAFQRKNVKVYRILQRGGRSQT